MSKKIEIIMIFACVLMIVAGVAMYLTLDGKTDTQLDQTTIIIEEETTKTLTAELKDLYPGSTKEYEIKLDRDSDEDYNITILFREKTDGALKDYIDVKITAGDTMVEKPLKDLLTSDEAISLDGKATTIKITYTMDENAGNDTQNTDIGFYIDLTVKKIEE